MVASNTFIPIFINRLTKNFFFYVPVRSIFCSIDHGSHYQSIVWKITITRYIPITLQVANNGECKIGKLSVIRDRNSTLFLAMFLKKFNVASAKSKKVS